MAKQRDKKPSETLLKLQLGDRVEVTLDDGATVKDTVYHEPTKLGGHTWVAWLNGLGSYLLTRCRKV